jgi:TIR domain
VRIFLSYRDDNAGHAGRVHDALEYKFGRDLFFVDPDSSPLGESRTKMLNDVARCDVLIALIGPHWIDAADDHGNQRLKDPNDVVRRQIATAFERGMPVIPVLLDGAKMPAVDQLPEDLHDLALRKSLDIRHASFHDDMDTLIWQLRDIGRRPRGRRAFSPGKFAREFAIATGVVVVVVFASPGILLMGVMYNAFVPRFLGLPDNVTDGQLFVPLVVVVILASIGLRRRVALVDMHPALAYALLAAPIVLVWWWYLDFWFALYRNEGIEGIMTLGCGGLLVVAIVKLALMRVTRG